MNEARSKELSSLGLFERKYLLGDWRTTLVLSWSELKVVTSILLPSVTLLTYLASFNFLNCPFIGTPLPFTEVGHILQRMPQSTRILFLAYCGVALSLLKEFNNEVVEPYMVWLSRL